jgi:hypothetical protein
MQSSKEVQDNVLELIDLRFVRYTDDYNIYVKGKG